MWQYVVKIALAGIAVVAISEVGKRSTLWGAAIASLPFTSLLAFVWIYHDTGDTERVAALAHSIFWLILASSPLFLLLPVLLRSGFGFWASFALTCASTVTSYFLVIRVLGMFGVRL